MLLKSKTNIKIIAALLVCACPLSWAQEQSNDSAEEAAHSTEAVPVFRLGRQASWLFRSFLRDEGDDADSLGLEFESYLNLGSYEIKNISYFEVNKFPRAIPGQPPGNAEPGDSGSDDAFQEEDGIGDLLSGFWFSKRGAHHGKHHFSLGFAAQFPTADDKTLGTGKYALGPSLDYEYENGPLFAGAIALQLWSVAGDDDRKDVNMMMIKPFVYYTLNPRWDLMYVPYGIQVYWDKPSGDQVYLPVGGGVQRKIKLQSSTQLNLGGGLYYNALRPETGTEWDLRFLVEFNF
jgi:hypothetical protein